MNTVTYKIPNKNTNGVNTFNLQTKIESTEYLLKMAISIDNKSEMYVKFAQKFKPQRGVLFFEVTDTTDSPEKLFDELHLDGKNKVQFLPSDKAVDDKRIRANVSRSLGKMLRQYNPDYECICVLLFPSFERIEKNRINNFMLFRAFKIVHHDK